MKRKIKLENGFSCTIDDIVLDDMEFVDLLADAEENPILIGKIVAKLYGENKKALYDHLRTKDGRVPVSLISTVIEETFNQMGEPEKN